MTLKPSYRSLSVLSLLVACLAFLVSTQHDSFAEPFQQPTPSSHGEPNLAPISIENVQRVALLHESTFSDLHSRGIRSLDWSASGRRLVVGTPFGIWILDFDDSLPEARLLTAMWGEPLAISGDGRLLYTAIAGQELAVFDLDTGLRKSVFENGMGQSEIGYYGLSLSHGGTLLATIDLNGQVVVWDAHTGEVANQLDGTTLGIAPGIPSLVVEGIAFHPNDRSIAFSDKLDPHVYFWQFGSTPVRFDGEQQEHITTSIHELAFSPDGSMLAASDYGGHVQVWQTETGQHALLQTHTGNAGATGIAFSPDGLMLAVGTGDGTIEFWSMGTLERIRILEARPLGPEDDYQSSIWSLAWSPDGSIIATGGLDDRLRLWGVPERGR